jgi:hypothetical protein
MQSMADFTNMTERLALMPDPALQQFAQMHRDDPFTLALAVSESNRRKKMRTAQQGLAGMQQQAPVADQEIAQMNEPAMPENVGIGALPAPVLAGMPAGGIAGEEEMEPQTMAGGGLVAFADGGNVERYQSAGLTRPQFVQDIMALPQAFDDYKQRLREEDARRAEMDRRMAQARADRLAAQQKTSFANYLFGSPETEAAGLAELADISNARNLSGTDRRLAANPRSLDVSSPAAAAVAATQTPSPTDPNFRRLPDPRMAGITLPDLRSAAGAPAAPGAAPDAAPGANPAVPGGGLGDLNALYNRILAGQTYTDPAAAQLTALETKEREAAQAEKTALERDQAKFAEAFKGREARLGKREAEIGKQKDTNTGLAFLNAGLAIMSTPGGLATAIGKGAQVGTQQFAAGLDKIRSAQEKLDEARDRMEELKLNRDEMSAKEVRAAESKIRQVGIDAQKRGIDGVRQAAGVNRETAKTLFDKTVQVGATREEIASRERIAATQERGVAARANAGLQATLSSPERLAFASELRKTITADKPQGDPLEAYRRITEAKREPMSMEQLRKDWSDMTKRLQISQDYPNVKTFEDYAAIMGVGSGGGGGGGFSLVGTRPAQ